MDEVERLSDGRITFERFYGGALGTMAETLGMVKDGVVDLGTTNFQAHPAEFPLFGMCFTFPFSSNDPSVSTAAGWIINDEFPDWAEKPAAVQNQILISTVTTDAYGFISPKRMVTLEDFKGKVIGLWGIYMPKWVEVLGASGVATPAVDRYMLLKDGIIDSSLLLMTAKVDMKHYEVAKYLLIPKIGCYGPTDTLSMNLDSWNKLPPELQKLMLDQGRLASIEWHTIRTRYRMALAVDALIEQGVTVDYMSEEDKTKWLQVMDDYPAGWAIEMEALGLPGWEIARRWIEVHKEFFHEWPRAWAIKK